MGRKPRYTEEQCAEIVSRFLAGERGAALAKEFGCCPHYPSILATKARPGRERKRPGQSLEMAARRKKLEAWVDTLSEEEVDWYLKTYRRMLRERPCRPAHR